MRRKLVIAVLLLAPVALAGSVKVWGTEALLATDLNTVIAHLHDNLRGGTHTLITNADLSASAAVAHSKLATPGLLPKYVGSLTTACSAGTCAVAESAGLTFTITYVSPGLYNVAFSARTDADYMATATAITADHYCTVHTRSTTAFRVECQLHDGTATNTAFDLVFWDADN